jgi:hypothetical protein
MVIETRVDMAMAIWKSSENANADVTPPVTIIILLPVGIHSFAASSVVSSVRYSLDECVSLTVRIVAKKNSGRTSPMRSFPPAWQHIETDDANHVSWFVPMAVAVDNYGDATTSPFSNGAVAVGPGTFFSTTICWAQRVTAANVRADELGPGSKGPKEGDWARCWAHRCCSFPDLARRSLGGRLEQKKDQGGGLNGVVPDTFTSGSTKQHYYRKEQTKERPSSPSDKPWSFMNAL